MPAVTFDVLYQNRSLITYSTELCYSSSVGAPENDVLSLRWGTQSGVAVASCTTADTFVLSFVVSVQWSAVSGEGWLRFD